MKHSLLFLFFIIAVATILFAQSNYEIMLNRPDITGLTGGGATNLNGIATTGLAEGTMVTITVLESTFVDAYIASDTFNIHTVTRAYRLTAGTDAENLPYIVRPDDYAAGTNEKVWKVRISSRAGETGSIYGYVRINDNGTLTATEVNFGAGSAEDPVVVNGIVWNTILNRFDVLYDGIYEITFHAGIQTMNINSDSMFVRIRVNGVEKNKITYVTHCDFFGTHQLQDYYSICWAGQVNAGQNITATYDSFSADNIMLIKGSSLIIRKLD